MKSLRIEGYRPFRALPMDLEDIQILVGANGTGKSSLFEFLRFLRDSMNLEIPPGIITGYTGQQVFHVPGPPILGWSMTFDFTGVKRIWEEVSTVKYSGELRGPIGRPSVTFEYVHNMSDSSAENAADIIMCRNSNDKTITAYGSTVNLPEPKRNRLILGNVLDETYEPVYLLREFINGWKFYSSFNMNTDRIRKSVLVEQAPQLREDAGNLSSVLHFLMTEYNELFSELQFHLRDLVPGFESLKVIGYGAPGEVMAFWRETGCSDDLTLADLSDGTLRLLCWLVLCLQPNPPTLVCIDEPDQGVHPRTLPLLAALFEKATVRTQFILATHNSYFLTQFDVKRIVVLRKKDGEIEAVRPRDSKIMRANLEEFGADEIESMHRSDEMEILI
jgi:predicted ATPase